MPIWAMCLTLIWMWFIPYFTGASLDAIMAQQPDTKPVLAKSISLGVGLAWPIIMLIGLYQKLTSR